MQIRMASTLNPRMNDRRERRFEHLEEATGENTTAGAIDTAAQYYLRMAGGTGAYPTGLVEELIQLAIEEGSVTPQQIADVLGCEELPISYDREWSLGVE